MAADCLLTMLGFRPKTDDEIVKGTAGAVYIIELLERIAKSGG
jgi:hypothetical protein